MTLTAERAAGFITDGLARAGRSGVSVVDLRRLTGGASRSTWTADLDNGATVVLQVSSAPLAGNAPRPTVSVETSLVSSAADVGVPVADVIAVQQGDLDDAESMSWALTSYVEGESIARRILRDDTYSVARGRFADQCGTALARIHTIASPVVDALDDDDPIDRYREVLDTMGHPSPAFELGFRWLGRHRPASPAKVLVHGDFRLGNLLIDQDGLAAVLDWELAHRGDPGEDLGWLCVRAWRFGGPKTVGGMSDVADLVDAYNREARRIGSAVPDISIDHVRWWTVMGTLKWGIMCVTQASRYLLDAGGTHEHAAIGRRVAENEWDLLELIS